MGTDIIVKLFPGTIQVLGKYTPFLSLPGEYHTNYSAPERDLAVYSAAWLDQDVQVDLMTGEYSSYEHRACGLDESIIVYRHLAVKWSGVVMRMLLNHHRVLVN